VQGFVFAAESHPAQLPNTDAPVAVAVSVTGVPLVYWVRQGVGLEQLRPAGSLDTVPVPFPAKARVSTGDPAPPPPELVKQVTFAVMNPVISAPDEESPPWLEFVVTVAEMSVPPHDSPVAVSKPVESTVNICGVFELHVTWFVMSLVTGGWMYVPSARSCTWEPALSITGVVDEPKVSTAGWIWIDTNC
jgi:hypothetical protein